jgi:hypothetical protein
MKLIRILVRTLLAFLGFAFVYFHFTPLAISDVEISPLDSCDDDNMNIETIVNTRWEGNILTATITEPQTCGELFMSARVQRFRNQLFIRTLYKADGPVATCYCQHHFQLGIPNLPKQNYEISVYNIP